VKHTYIDISKSMSATCIYMCIRCNNIQIYCHIVYKNIHVGRSYETNAGG
jgi:hypothetical protein